MITSSPTTWFPLLSKELIELANRRRTYLIRFVYATLLFSLGLLILYGRHGVSADVGTRLGEGRAMFDELVWLQMAGIYLFLPAMTAGAFTLEKERDTLTLLLLTTMPPWTIVVQKYLSRVVPMLCYVILSFPLMAVSYSHGGVTTGTLYFAMVLLILTVLHVAAVSVMCSSFCRTTVESFLASYGLLAVSATCCPIFSPVQILRHASMIQGMTTLTAIILVLMGTGACLILARACLLKRAFIPPRNFLLEFFQALDRMYHEWNQVTGGIVLVDDGRELPDDKPVAWRETSKRSLGTFRYLFRVLVLLELPILFVAQQVRLNAISNQSVVTNLYYLVWGIGGAMVCIHAASVISSERSRQTLDSLLTAPVSGRSLMLEKLSGVQRLLNVLMVPFLTIIVFNHWLRDYGRDFRYLILSLASVVILPQVFAWVSFLLGLRIKSQMKAVFASLACVAVFSTFSVLLETVFRVMSVPVPAAISFLFQFSPAAVVTRLETWFELSRGTGTDPAFVPTVTISVVLAIDFLIWLGLRWYCLSNADWLLGRMDEKRAHRPESMPLPEPA